MRPIRIEITINPSEGWEYRLLPMKGTNTLSREYLKILGMM